MKNTDIQLSMSKIRSILKYHHVQYIRKKDTRLYFSALDQNDNQHDIWYNIKSGNYFETINGCAVLIKEMLFSDTKETLPHYKQK